MPVDTPDPSEDAGDPGGPATDAGDAGTAGDDGDAGDGEFTPRVRVRDPLEPGTPDPENVAFVLVGVLFAVGLLVASL